VGHEPIGVHITPDGKRAYVLTRSQGPSGSGAFSVVDLATDTVTKEVDLNLLNIPSGSVMTPDGGKIYVSARFNKIVTVFDTATDSRVADIPLGGEGSTIVMTPDGTRVYALAIRSNPSIKVIDTATDTVTATIPVTNDRHRSMAVTPDGKELWVGVNFGDLTPDFVRIIDTATNTDIDTVPGLFNPSTIVFTPVISVEIDIKPESDDNTINLGSKGNIPVAILSSATFDATKIDPATVALANSSVKLKGKGTAMASVEDVNDDGRDDLVVHIDTTALELTGEDVEAVLTGKLETGQPFRGLDSVTIVKE